MSKKKKSLITITATDDLHLLICTSFDYCFGRCTYVTAWFPQFVIDHAEEIPTCTLRILERRLDEAEKAFPLWQDSLEKYHRSNYGEECDRESWLAFQQWVKRELVQRGEEPITSPVEGAK
jgi:hypothetical protein